MNNFMESVRVSRVDLTKAVRGLVAPCAVETGSGTGFVELAPAASDDEVDHLYSQVFRELLTDMIEDPKTIQRATHLLMAAQAVERMGDHATNIAERVIYMVTGTFRELNL